MHLVYDEPVIVDFELFFCAAIMCVGGMPFLAPALACLATVATTMHSALNGVACMSITTSKAV